MLQGQTAAWPYLRFETCWQLNEKPRRDKRALHWLYNHIFCKIRPQIHPGGSLSFVSWQWVLREIYDLYVHLFASICFNSLRSANRAMPAKISRMIFPAMR